MPGSSPCGIQAAALSSALEFFAELPTEAQAWSPFGAGVTSICDHGTSRRRREGRDDLFCIPARVGCAPHTLRMMCGTTPAGAG
jgi:hypothetical protein